MPQDILQVWFAGVHSDVGGGYPEARSGDSKYPLIWMIAEAEKAGLNFNHATIRQLARASSARTRRSNMSRLITPGRPACCTIP